ACTSPHLGTSVAATKTGRSVVSTDGAAAWWPVPGNSGHRPGQIRSAGQAGRADEGIPEGLDPAHDRLELAERVAGVEEEARGPLGHGQVDPGVGDDVRGRPRRVVVDRVRLVVTQVLRDDLLAVDVVDLVGEELAECLAVVQRLAAELASDEDLPLVTG